MSGRLRGRQVKVWGLMACLFPAKPAVKSMPLCRWGATTRDSRPDGDEAQPMVSRGGLKVLLHWAGPDGGDPWVTFSEATLTAEEVCIHIAHKVGESGASAMWWGWGVRVLRAAAGPIHPSILLPIRIFSRHRVRNCSVPAPNHRLWRADIPIGKPARNTMNRKQQRWLMEKN